jgi:hypothetical protein
MRMTGRITRVALALLALAAGAGAQTPAPAVPPPPAPESASPVPAPASAPAPTLAEQLSALRQEQTSLVAEIETLRSRLAASDPGAAEARALAALETRLAAVASQIEELRRAVRLATPAALTGPRGPADPAGMGSYQVLGDSGQVSSGTAFNPQISVIPDGVYFNDNRDGASEAIAADADGFHSHGAGGHSHGGDTPRGFSLREAEMTFSGAVDPYFDVWAIFAVADGEIEVEEAYVLTRKLLPGLQLKFGKFYSGIGYINKQHPHQWDFVDGPLPYTALLGGAINEAGIQLTWLPNLSFYTQLGVEALQGANDGIATQIGPSDEAPWLSSRAGPRLFTAFLKVSPNIGYSDTLQVGASYAYSSQQQELHDANEDGTVDEAFQGHAQLFGLDAVWKHDSPRQYGKGDLTVQAEYLYRKKDLDLVAEAGQGVSGGPVRFSQDGLYVQAVYGVLSRWTVGVRFDTIGLTNHVEGLGESLSFDASRRYTADLTFNPTEFSRLRAQVAHGDFAAGGTRQTYNQVYVQFQMSLGAHGAHRF